MRLLALGRLLVCVDAVYWLWMMGHDDEAHLAEWHVWVNRVTFYGGWVLFLIVAILGLARSRARHTAGAPHSPR